MSEALRHAVLYVQRTFGRTDFVIVSDHDIVEDAITRARNMSVDLQRSETGTNAFYRVVALPESHIEVLRFERPLVRNSETISPEELEEALTEKLL